MINRGPGGKTLGPTTPSPLVSALEDHSPMVDGVVEYWWVGRSRADCSGDYAHELSSLDRADHEKRSEFASRFPIRDLGCSAGNRSTLSCPKVEVPRRVTSAGESEAKTAKTDCAARGSIARVSLCTPDRF
jgi:hypothetical protein